MTISYVGSAAAEATSVTLPAHQAGDLIVFFAWNGGSSTVPTVPSGWSILFYGTRSSGANRAYSLGFKQAASSAETSGTWTNAALVGVAVYRHSTNVITIGGQEINQDNNSTSFAFPSISAVTALNRVFNKLRGANTWIVGVGGINANNLAFETPPSGMTNRLNLAGASANEISIHDTDADVASYAGANVTLAATGIGIASCFEIYDTGVPKSSGGGFRPVNIRGGADQ